MELTCIQMHFLHDGVNFQYIQDHIFLMLHKDVSSSHDDG